MKHRPIATKEHPDAVIEEMRRDLARAITDLQRDMNEQQALIIANVTLPDATPVTVPHKLGRAPQFVRASVVRGAAAAGYINEIRSAAIDRAKYIQLQADDFGATIVLDLEVR